MIQIQGVNIFYGSKQKMLKKHRHVCIIKKVVNMKETIVYCNYLFHFSFQNDPYLYYCIFICTLLYQFITRNHSYFLQDIHIGGKCILNMIILIFPRITIFIITKKEIVSRFETSECSTILTLRLI